MVKLFNIIERSYDGYKIVLSDEIKQAGFVKDDFYWSSQGFDTAICPDEILTIPLILNIAPVIWALNVEVEIESIDEQLFASLGGLRQILKKMYPALSWEGRLVPKKLVAVQGKRNNNALVLFSGGVDSVFTALSHIDEHPALLTVRGSDIPLSDHEGWDAVKVHNREFGETYGFACYFVESNFHDFLDYHKLGSLTNTITHWWTSVQYGMGFVGLTAPVAFNIGVSELYRAADIDQSFTSNMYASNPEIDNAISWSGYRVIYDGYEYSRQSKIRYIVEAVGWGQIPPPVLRVCYSQRTNADKNCCMCKKCILTLTAILAEGANPSDFGFDEPIEASFKQAKSIFRRIRCDMPNSSLIFWKNMQESIRDPGWYRAKGLDAYLIDYLQWVRGCDFEKCHLRWRYYQSLTVKRRTIKAWIKGVIRGKR